ncbi:MAG: hypothetical protein WC879_13015 [Melioribacteraceae bacterium]
METNSISQELFVYLHLKKIKKSQSWLAKKISTSKRKYYQPEVSRALAGKDPQLLQIIFQSLRLASYKTNVE